MYDLKISIFYHLYMFKKDNIIFHSLLSLMLLVISLAAKQDIDLKIIHNTTCTYVYISVSLGFFDDIIITSDSLQHPTRLYPFWSKSLLHGKDTVNHNA